MLTIKRNIGNMQIRTTTHDDYILSLEILQIYPSLIQTQRYLQTQPRPPNNLWKLHNFFIIFFQTKMSFSGYKEVIEENDVAFLYINFSTIYPVKVTAKTLSKKGIVWSVL